MRSVWIVVLLTMTALAGCTDGGPDTDPISTGIDGGGVDTDRLVTVQANTSETEAITFTSSGSFTAADTFCVPSCNYDDHDLTAKMEPDTAYFLEAILKSDQNQAGFDVAYMWDDLQGISGIRDDDDVDYSGEFPIKTATLLAAGNSPVYLRVGVNGLVTAEGGDYTVEIKLTPVPGSIPQYAPAAVTVPEGGALVVESLSGAGRVMVFDGNDALLGVFDVDGPTTVVNETDRLQEFVVFTLDDIWAKAYVEQDPDAVAPELRHVPLEVSWADLGTVSEAGSKSFTFDVDRPALNVAFRFGSFKSCGTSTDGCYISIGTTAYLQGPDGSELTGTDNYNCYLCGGGAYYRTPYDDGPMPAGTYTVEYNSENSYDVRLHSSTIHYIR